MKPSIFTKIINGEIPAYKIYEDERTIAFLDISPALYGHTLVVPKVQIDQYIDLADDDYYALWATVKKVAAKLREHTGKERVEVVIKGIDVPHTHVHLIPFNAGENTHRGNHSPQPTAEEFATLAQMLQV